jgi:acyl carrier protein
MKQDTEQQKAKIKSFLLEHLLKHKNIGSLADDTPLITGGLIDSISTMQLVTYLEKEFDVEYAPHEVDKDNFDSVQIIADFLSKKL